MHGQMIIPPLRVELYGIGLNPACEAPSSGFPAKGAPPGLVVWLRDQSVQPVGPFS